MVVSTPPPPPHPQPLVLRLTATEQVNPTFLSNGHPPPPTPFPRLSLSKDGTVNALAVVSVEHGVRGGKLRHEPVGVQHQPFLVGPAADIDIGGGVHSGRAGHNGRPGESAAVARDVFCAVLRFVSFFLFFCHPALMRVICCAACSRVEKKKDRHVCLA